MVISVRQLEAEQDGSHFLSPAQGAWPWADAPGLWAYAGYTVLGFVERWTHDMREARRRVLSVQADERHDRAKSASSTDRWALLRSAKWYDGRARGQRDRFWDLRHCGEGYLDVTCRACGDDYRRKLGCCNTRLCVPCRDARAGHRRAVVWRARAEVAEAYKAAGALSRHRDGGAWTEKDFTLTLPDAHPALCGHDAVEQRINVLFAAWPHFAAHLNAYLRTEVDPAIPALRPGEPLSSWPRALVRRASLRVPRLGGGHRVERFRALRAVWHRGFEWTPGWDGQGHPHFHVWFWGPWLPADAEADELRAWWADALCKAGIEVEPEDLVHCYVRKVRPQYIVQEVIKGREKYTTRRLKLIAKRAASDGSHPFSYVEGWHVDFKGKHGGQDASALTQARVFAALEGRRTVQASVGFLGLGQRLCCCPSCEAVLVQSPDGWKPVLSTEVTGWREAHDARAPPTVTKARHEKPVTAKAC